MAMNPPIDKLFNKNRLDGTVLQLLLLTFYMPLGVVLMVVRFFISLQLMLAVTVLPRGATITRLILRCLCGVLGLLVRQEKLENNPLYEDDDDGYEAFEEDSDANFTSTLQERGAKRKLVVVSNHVTPFDHFALSTVMPCIKLSCNGEGIPWPLSYLLGNQVINLQLTPIAPTVPSSETSFTPLPPPRRDEVFLSKLKAFVMSGRLPYSNTASMTTTTTSVSGSPDNSRRSTIGDSNISGSGGGQRRGSGSGNGSLSDLPLLVFPEDATTNGTVAVMQYAPWCGSVCGLRPSVVCIRVRRVPSLPLAPSVLCSTFTQELLALFFCPLTVYTVRYLGRVSRQLAESDADFSKRLQSVSAEALGLRTTTYDALEKAEHVKRCLLARQQQSAWTSSSPASGDYHQVPPSRHLAHGSARVGGDLRMLAQQVHEVLPHLPLTAIIRDVARTGDVDVTITNFLEGSVPDYTAPTPSSPSSMVLDSPATSSSSSSSLPPSPQQRTPTSSYSVSGPFSSASNSPVVAASGGASHAASYSTSRGAKSSDRNLPFNERKAQLLESAFRHYVEKFGLHGEKDPYLGNTGSTS